MTVTSQYKCSIETSLLFGGGGGGVLPASDSEVYDSDAAVREHVTVGRLLSVRRQS